MPYVYILRCRDGALYVGQAEDVLKREQTHNRGRGARFTAARRPVTAVYAEHHGTALAATARERQLKRWTRGKKDALIARDLALLKRL
jgi:putative endonuclease